MIRVTDTICLRDRDIHERFVRSAGARGQNLRRQATAVELTVDVHRTLLPLEVQQRLVALGGRQVNNEGVLTIVSRANRSQLQNRDAARARLAVLLTRAATAPPDRTRTRPLRSARDERLAAKHRKSAIKRSRHTLDDTCEPARR